MRIVTGIQPTGALHLGNYLGAIRPLVDMQDAAQDEVKFFAFIADLHTLSTPMPADERRDGVIKMAAALLACGVRIERTTLFRQSDVPHHAELQFLLNGIARMGPLERMTQHKDKVAGLGEDTEGVRLALFTYPVLQAADILLYRGTHVPVGEDQRQHLELVRQLAYKFNREYAKDHPVFTVPQANTDQTGARVMSLQDGTRKMSKSDPSEISRITLMDDKDTIARKVRKAKSDMDALPYSIDELRERPEAMNLLNIHAALAGQSVLRSIAEFAGLGFGQLKGAIVELLHEQFLPIGEEYRRIIENPGGVEIALRIGAKKAREEAAPVMREAYAAMGFG